MTRSKKVKRRYLVDGRYQFTQLLAVVLANILVVLLVAALLSWFYLLAWDGSVAYNHNQRIPVYVVGCLLVVILASSYFSMRRSRETAGMMKKLRSVLENAGKGVFPEQPLMFRRSDHYKDMAEPLNTCLEQLKAQQEQEGQTDIRQRLKELADEIEQGRWTQEQLVQKLQDIAR